MIFFYINSNNIIIKKLWICQITGKYPYFLSYINKNLKYILNLVEPFENIC